MKLFSYALFIFIIQLSTSYGELELCENSPIDGYRIDGYNYIGHATFVGTWIPVNGVFTDQECADMCSGGNIQGLDDCSSFSNMQGEYGGMEYARCAFYPYNDNFIYASSSVDNNSMMTTNSIATTYAQCLTSDPTTVSIFDVLPPPTPGAGGDPHIKTWTGEQYDFHGVCDLVLLNNPEFHNGHGMNIHIRNMRYGQVWSYISTIAVGIGESVLQIMGGRNSMEYFLNGMLKDAGSSNSESIIDDFAGYKLMIKRTSSKAVEYNIILGNTESILLKTWNKFVSVSVKNPQTEHFRSSVGLMGSFSNGMKLARDNVTIISDSNIFGQEWQVIGSEPTLFVENEGPQFPSKCDIPSTIDMRRRLENSIVTIETAKAACEGIIKQDKDLCIFDVMATNDVGLAGAY